MLSGDIVFVGLFLAILYFMVLRPQTQERQRHDDLLASLKVDLDVVTRSGLHGRIVEVGADTVVLQIADKTRVTIDKQAVFRRAGEPVTAAAQGV